MSALAALGGSPVRAVDRAWHPWPVHDKTELDLMTEVIESGKWSYEGPKEQEFAATFAAYQDSAYGFCVSSGTVALEVALRAVGVGPGDEVIVPSLTWIATASATLAVGAAVVFVDVDPSTYQLDPAAVEHAITSRTRAIIPVHLYSRLADMDAINAVAARHDLVVVEDAAQAHGAVYRGRKTGSLGDVGCFSFQASKTLQCGEGGFVTTNDADVASRAYAVRNCGRAWHDGKTRQLIGRNFRITEFQAAILLAQFGRLEEQMSRRERAAARLDAELGAIDGIAAMATIAGVDRQSYYTYLFRYDAAAFGGASVDAFRAALRAEGVPCDATYGPVWATELWAPAAHDQWRIHSGAVAEHANDEAVLFHQPQLLSADRDLDDIVAAVHKIRDHADELIAVAAERAQPASVAAPRA